MRGRNLGRRDESLKGALKILLIESDRLAAAELRDFLHFIGHVALWSDDGRLLPEGLTFDLVMLALTEHFPEGADVIERIAALNVAPAIAIMSDGPRHETEAACALAKRVGLDVFSPLQKPLRPEQVAAMLEEPSRLATGRPGAGSINLTASNARQAGYVFQSKHALRSGTVVGYETLLRVPGVDAINRWFAGLDHGSAFAMTVAAARAAFSLSKKLGGAHKASLVAFHCPPEIFGDARFLAELTRISAGARERGENGSIAIELTTPADPDTLSDILPIAFRYVLAGFELHMSDFSMNPASLEQAARLPINEAKIDRRFFEDLSRDDPQLLDEIISLFRLRGIKSTVARIEAANECEVARQAGADFGQGYFWSHPTESVRF